MKNLSQQPITIPPEPEVWPSLTIVLPVRNEEIVLKKKLENLEAQEYPIDKIELIVIDSNSSDSTLDILEEWDSSRKSKFTLSTLKTNDFPIISDSDLSTKFVISAEELTRIIDKTKLLEIKITQLIFSLMT